MLNLVLGGRRSGKSAWAEQKAVESPRPVLIYLATCRQPSSTTASRPDSAQDQGMLERIAQHQERRAQHARRWILYEEPENLSAALSKIEQATPDCMVLLDCLTLWLSNLMETLTDAEITTKIRELAETARNFTGDLLIISNETGLGIAPANNLGNRFIDLSGMLNQEVASAADEVIFIAAGLPLCLKPYK